MLTSHGMTYKTLWEEKLTLTHDRLSTGFGLLRAIIEQEHPSALYYVLEALCRLKQHGFHEICELIRRYITRMCNIVLTQGHPWASMWRLLGEIDATE